MLGDWASVCKVKLLLMLVLPLLSTPYIFRVISLALYSVSCRELFEKYYGLLQRKPRLVFAEPGTERQDSVSNGFKVLLLLPIVYLWTKSIIYSV